MGERTVEGLCLALGFLLDMALGDCKDHALRSYLEVLRGPRMTSLSRSVDYALNKNWATGPIIVPNNFQGGLDITRIKYAI